MITPITYPGSKWSYAEWIISLIPEHKIYLEPFFGSGAAFFNKRPSLKETINDIDNLVVNFFKVCRDDPDELARLLYFTPFSRNEFMSIQEPKNSESIVLSDNEIENARRFAVRAAQGFGSKMACRVGWKNTKKSTGPNCPKIWSKIPESVYHVAERLKEAQIECMDGIELIKKYNFEDCFIYADPPYPINVRKGKLYKIEMTEEYKHINLLKALLDHKGTAMISSYDNDIYNDMLKGWAKATKKGRANSGEERIEVIWMNYKRSGE